MKWAIMVCGLLLIPLQAVAVSDFELNGLKECTITSLPADVVSTCDLADSGNELEVEIYVDLNMSGTIDAEDLLGEFLVLTDGIGWIRDPDTGDDISGDETPVDGKIRSTMSFTEEDEIWYTGRYVLKVKDEDGSTDTAVLNLHIRFEPPLITGKVTDFSTGDPLAQIFVMAERADESPGSDAVYGMTDASGDYSIKVEAGAWQVIAFDYVLNEYMASDTADITVGEEETKTVNLQLHKYDSFVDGHIRKLDGSAVPGIFLMAGDMTFFQVSRGYSGGEGYYKLGVEPGQVRIWVSNMMNLYMAGSQWPEGFYVDSEFDTVTVASGQTVRSDFIFKPYTAFIEGDCRAGGSLLPGVEITALLATSEFRQSLATSNDQGHYRIGVLPGTVAMLTAQKSGFNLISPLGGYRGISIAEGQTITGKDFTFGQPSGAMSIAGRVRYQGGGSAGNVYVVAVLEEEDSRDGYRISYTDGSGRYQFDRLLEGYWKVGVFKDGYSSTPYMQREFMTPGTSVTGADFTLGSPTAVGEEYNEFLPDRFALVQNYPNPFNPATSIQFAVGSGRSAPHVNLKVFNLLGQEVATLVDEVKEPGYYSVTWDAAGMASGVYFCRLSAGEFSQTMRLVLMR